MARQTQYLRVKNSTGEVIKKGIITHATENYGIQTINVENLEDGAYSDIKEVYTGPMSRDYWWITWTNDGLNYVAFTERNAIVDHDNQENPGTIELIGKLPNSEIGVCFHTDKSKKDYYEIKTPWD